LRIARYCTPGNARSSIEHPACTSFMRNRFP
jgi:hypothetical protein